jgi:uncharacterized protein (DUF983 family)
MGALPRELQKKEDKEMSGLEGRCPTCGTHYSGWALKSPWYQICDRCGAELEIKDWQAEGLGGQLPERDRH